MSARRMTWQEVAGTVGDKEVGAFDASTRDMYTAMAAETYITDIEKERDELRAALREATEWIETLPRWRVDDALRARLRKLVPNE